MHQQMEHSVVPQDKEKQEVNGLFQPDGVSSTIFTNTEHISS